MTYAVDRALKANYLSILCFQNLSNFEKVNIDETKSCVYVCVCGWMGVCVVYVWVCVCMCACASVASHISETSEAIAIKFHTVTTSVTG